MREICQSGSEGGARFNPSFLPLSMAERRLQPASLLGVGVVCVFPRLLFCWFRCLRIVSKPTSVFNAMRNISTLVLGGLLAATSLLAADAKEDGPAAGPTGNFVPEPGFKSLFNGRDLSGWAG